MPNGGTSFPPIEIPFYGGIASTPSYGRQYTISFNGIWAKGDNWTIQIASTAGDFTVGNGEWFGSPSTGSVAGSVPAGAATACFTYRGREYVALGNQWIFSDNGDPTGFEVQSPGAGSELFLSEIGQQDEIGGFSQLQGRLAVFGLYSIQLWIPDADPANFSQAQVLENIGTKAPLSIQNLGDYDVLFLDATGVRSLRSREVTLNAFIDDLGSPVDDLVQPQLTDAQWRAACGIVDPATKNYWLFLGDTIFVFSRHHSAKVAAWSTYDPVDNMGDVFTPEKFVNYKGIVYVRSVQGTLLQYGGADGNQYDGSVVIIETYWMDNRKPATLKAGWSFDSVCSGAWLIYGGMDPVSGQLELLYNNINADSLQTPDETRDSTFDAGSIPFMTIGTHYKFRAISSSKCVSAQTLSSFLIKDERGDII